MCSSVAASRTRPTSTLTHLVPPLIVSLVAWVSGCASTADGATGVEHDRSHPTVSATASASASAGTGADNAHRGRRRAAEIPLGAGLLAFPDAADQWVQAHPRDGRTPTIARRIASQPTALWLTGDSSFGNLDAAVAQAQSTNRTMVLSLYDIPMRWDGLSAPSQLGLRAYQRWIDQVAATIGTTRAIIVLEPDALWFYDRLPTDRDRQVRMRALGYAVDTLAARASRTRVYLDAGTSSGSVTPQRMATLLLQAGIARAAGYAVNTSSYAPTATIQAYAQQIRAALQAGGLADPRYVTDTGRNGAATRNDDWCNPPGQLLGAPPAVLGTADGRDLDLWIKAPGTSDGDCGPPGRGAGTYGGQFLPSLAYAMTGR